jgi:hypothetical protein
LGIAFLIGMASYLAVVWRPSWTTVAIWNGWNVVILLTAYRAGPTSPELEEVVTVAK